MLGGIREVVFDGSVRCHLYTKRSTMTVPTKPAISADRLRFVAERVGRSIPNIAKMSRAAREALSLELEEAYLAQKAQFDCGSVVAYGGGDVRLDVS
jgi:hypothetical protein